MTNEEILKSREVRMINIMIDDLVEDLKATEHNLQVAAQEYGNETLIARTLQIRTYEESPRNSSDREIGLVDSFRLEYIPILIEESKSLQSQIKYLQRVKLRLLNDDDTFQKKVFDIEE